MLPEQALRHRLRPQLLYVSRGYWVGEVPVETLHPPRVGRGRASIRRHSARIEELEERAGHVDIGGVVAPTALVGHGSSRALSGVRVGQRDGLSAKRVAIADTAHHLPWDGDDVVGLLEDGAASAVSACRVVVRHVAETLGVSGTAGLDVGAGELHARGGGRV